LLDKIWNPYADFEKKLICIDILREKYSPGLTTLKVLLSIVSLFGESKITDDHEGFANPKAASQMMNNYPFFC
jgi:ubiquitin-protein ligase